MERKPRVVISQSIPDLIVQCDNVHSSIVAGGFDQDIGSPQPVMNWANLRGNAATNLQTMQTDISNMKGALKAKVLERDALAKSLRDELRLLRDAIFVYVAPNYETIGQYGFDFYVGPEAGDPPAEPFEPV